jgi:voltage-gated potassium channel
MLIVGSIMYLVEGNHSGFTSIPQSIYWAVVTMTTVGYGDIAPTTVLGKFLASIVMIMGYGIIAVPTGIVTVELASAQRKTVSTQSCQ